MLTLVKRFTFEAGHFIPNHPKCGTKHGHSWTLKVSIQGEIKPNGMIVDFHDVKSIVQFHILERVDHKFLNDEFDFIPTCENITNWMWNQLEESLKATGVQLQRIKLCETFDNCISCYE